ncbi:MAG TPA: MlaE family lipid ABC transporter permease subunit [Deltaproteobacteria bacterium]|nr:MlaE family lipid ABC transporter permease subunit [Deltaproteobacteria bacterium]
MDIEQEWSKFYKILPEKKEKTLTLYLQGDFGLKNLNEFTAKLGDLVDLHKPLEVKIDFSGVTYLDSAAALAFIRMERFIKDKNVDCLLLNLTDEIKGIFSVIYQRALAQKPFKVKTKPDNFFVELGEASIALVKDFIDVIEFVGDLLFSIAYAITHPRSIRVKDIFFYMKRAGVDGLPIVGLISVLIGLIIAFMSFLQLKQIGANIYVPSLVSFAMVRELGPIMTAILVAGRSGSAFAAEIGTMVVNEEVDALKTMGFDPIRFLAVPKVLAAMIVVPILTIYSALFGVFGGMIVGVTGLDLTINTYLTQSLKAISVFDIVTSLIKAAVFAALIAGIGCQRGFKVRSGAQDVGKFTTSAVVSAIFLIVMADSIFAVTLYYIR